MRALLISFLLILSLISPSRALEPFATPRELLETAYAPYVSGRVAEDYSLLFSTSLKALYDKKSAEMAEIEMGAIDFDPFIDGQDFGDVSVEVADPAVDGNRARADVRVTNFGETSTLTFLLIKEGEGWLIDDISSATPDYSWRLSELLAASPLLN